MNERIDLIIQQATDTIEIVNPDTGITHHREFFDQEKFVGLVIKECYHALNPMLRDMISRGKAYDLIKNHFGINE